MRKWIILTVFMSTMTFCDEGKPLNEFGINFGWGHSFGNSIEYDRLIAGNQSLNGGIGFSFGGLKYGIGYKYIFNEESKFNPYFGTNISSANGLSEVTVNVNADSSKYKVNSGIAVTPRGGFRYQAGFANLYVNVGYGIVLSGGGVEYISGSTKESVADFAKVLGIAGLEVSGSMLFRF